MLYNSETGSKHAITTNVYLTIVVKNKNNNAAVFRCILEKNKSIAFTLLTVLNTQLSVYIHNISLEEVEKKTKKTNSWRLNSIG